MPNIIRLKKVIAKTDLSRSSIYRLASLGLFPKQLKLSQRSCGWIESEIDSWLEEKISQRV